MTMPAGTYYVGDLCYVMTDEEWDELFMLTFPQNDMVCGEFEFKDGRRVAQYGTAYGDGTYHSNVGTEHSVDSGSIGCILISDIKLEVSEDEMKCLGAIITFNEEFETYSVNGELVFGHVIIDTDPEYEDDKDEYNWDFDNFVD